MNLAGVFAPVPTPFDDRDRVDTQRLKAALGKWVKGPLTGVVEGWSFCHGPNDPSV